MRVCVTVVVTVRVVDTDGVGEILGDAPVERVGVILAVSLPDCEGVATLDGDNDGVGVSVRETLLVGLTVRVTLLLAVAVRELLFVGESDVV